MILAGEEEVKNKTITIKNMQTGEQKLIKIGYFVNFLSENLYQDFNY